MGPQPSSLPGVSGSWPPSRIVGTSRRVDASSPSAICFSLYRSTPHSDHRMPSPERVSSMSCVIGLLGVRRWPDPCGSSGVRGSHVARGSRPRRPCSRLPGARPWCPGRPPRLAGARRRRGNASRRIPRGARELPSGAARCGCRRGGGSARPARRRRATDTRGGRACRPGGRDQFHRVSIFSPEPALLAWAARPWGVELGESRRRSGGRLRRRAVNFRLIAEQWGRIGQFYAASRRRSRSTWGRAVPAVGADGSTAVSPAVLGSREELGSEAKAAAGDRSGGVLWFFKTRRCRPGRALS